MKRIILLFFILLSFTSCQFFETNKISSETFGRAAAAAGLPDKGVDKNAKELEFEKTPISQGKRLGAMCYIAEVLLVATAKKPGLLADIQTLAAEGKTLAAQKTEFTQHEILCMTALQDSIPSTAISEAIQKSGMIERKPEESHFMRGTTPAHLSVNKNAIGGKGDHFEKVKDAMERRVDRALKNPDFEKYHTAKNVERAETAKAAEAAKGQGMGGGV